MIRRAALLFALLMTLDTDNAASQQDWSSANYIVPGCRAYLANNIPMNQFSNATTCRATVSTLAWAGHEQLGFCVPDMVTDAQLMRVVVTYIDSAPARMHENFRVLSLEAFRKAWPCKK